MEQVNPETPVENEVVETVEDSTEQPKQKITISLLAERLDKQEEKLDVVINALEKVLSRIDINDKPVPVPAKKNYNPDYLPKSGGSRVTLADLPPKG